MSRRWLVLACGLSLSVLLGRSVTTARLAKTEASGRSYFVSPDGRDEADGRTPVTALRTLRHALSLVTAGDTVRLLPGEYPESIRARLVGRESEPIEIRSEGGGSILTGRRSRRYGLWLQDSQHVRIEGLDVRDYTDMGIALVLGNHVELSDLDVHDNGFRPRIDWVEGYGLYLAESSDLTIERNDVYRNGPNPRPPAAVGTGINLFDMRDTVVRRNRSYENFGGGILVEDSVNVLVEGNEVSYNDLDVSADGWWDGGLWLDGGSDVTVRRNTFHDNLGPGIEISDEERQSPRGYVLENNISTRNYFGIFIWNFGTTRFPPREVLRRSGNDFTGNTCRNVWIEP